MSEFVIVVRELEQSCGNGLPSELAPSADIDALLTYFDRPAAQTGAGPAAPAAAPAPPAPAEAGPPAPAPAEAGPPAPPVPAVDDAADAARALADAEAAAKELQAAAEAAAAQAASDAAAAEATRLATKAAADKAASDAAAEATRLAAEAVAAADAAAAAQAAADAAEAARRSDEAAAAVAATLFNDAALLEARGGIDDSIDTTFIDQMGNRPGPEARPKDAAAKQALRNFYDTDEEDTEEPRPVPAKKSADFPDAEPAAHVKRVIYQIEQKIAKQKADDIARSRADAAMENAAKAKAYAEFEQRDAEGEYAKMSSDEKALVRVKMAIAQSNKDYHEREAAELRQLEEKAAKRARKNGNAAAAAGRGAPKPSGRKAITKAFRKDLREGQKSFTDDNTILPKTALRRLVRCQLDMLGKEGVCISNGMLEVLQLACAGEVGSFMASAFMNTVNHKRKTLMVKDFNDVVKIASDPSTHNIAKEMYHEGVRKANQAKRNRRADA